MRFLARWLSTSIAVAIAVLIVPGIEITGGDAWVPIIVVGGVLGFVNATLGTVLKIGSCGCIILTLGLFNLVINAWLLSAAAWVAQNLFDMPFIVEGFWPAFWGGIVISIISTILGIFLPYKD